jgi:2,4-dienoyl-CoA reductase-like NADH-dependent reductase (Old Yellow Enzyme family)
VTHDRFSHLFTPIRVGSMEVRNRIVSSAHAEMMADDNAPGDRFIAYCAEKAKGGVGMMVTGVATVHPTSIAHPEKEAGGIILQVWDDHVIPAFRRLADEVHRYGAKILVQLWHGGINANSQDSYRPVWGPSPVPSIVYRDMPHEMTHAEIAEIIAAFASAAVRMQRAGIDGVELHAASGYLLNQFLSPYTNKRTDEYGGDPERRLRFVRETVAAVRAAVGKNFVVGIKIDADEYVPGGLTLEDTVRYVKQLEALGALDYFTVSCGIYHTLHMIIPPMRVPMGYADHLAAGVREAVEHTPVIALGRIKDPIQAEKILADGIADMVCMTRALISDPEMPIKAQTGRLEEIRNCVGCNQGCVGRLFTLRPVTCIQNPTIGFERELGSGTIEPAVRRKRV